MGRGYKLQWCLFKQEFEHDEIYEDKWEEKENERIPCLRNDVLSTAFSYARYTMAMEELTGFGMNFSTTLPSLASKYFNTLRDEKDEQIYTYTDPFLRHFVRQSIKGARCTALNQWYKSNISDGKFNIISKEIDCNAKKCDHLDKIFEYTNQH